MNLLKNFDIFAPGLAVNFRGEETHKTNLGGILGILSLCITVPYFITKAVELCGRGDTSVTFYKKYHDLEEIGLLQMETIDFDLAYQVTKKKSPSESAAHLLDDTYFKI